MGDGRWKIGNRPSPICDLPSPGEKGKVGLPVITTHNTGGPDVIGEGKEGIVVPAGNAEALREKMEWFIKNPERTAEMGKAAHRKAKEFTWERYGAEYAKIVREVV